MVAQDDIDKCVRLVSRASMASLKQYLICPDLEVFSEVDMLLAKVARGRLRAERRVREHVG